MQLLLLDVQLKFKLYNPDIEPEHDMDVPCNCPIHTYQYRKIRRLGVHEMWSKAVMYPGKLMSSPPPSLTSSGEKWYHDCYQMTGSAFCGNNPYRRRVISPYGNYRSTNAWGLQRPDAACYSRSVEQTIALNASLNNEAQRAVNAKEPIYNIWDVDRLDAGASSGQGEEKKKRQETGEVNSAPAARKTSKLASLKKALTPKTPEEKATSKWESTLALGENLRNAILLEEVSRWPDPSWRRFVEKYQKSVGMSRQIGQLRYTQPLQYLHLLRAGYFEPIPVAWANLASNPLKFSIDAAAGWRGITPAWRGFEDTAEERLYWVLNHREGNGARLKPDIISALNMARERMATAVEPPPMYYAPNDTCHLQLMSEGYSKQVMPPFFTGYDAVKTSLDDTMILLDASGSMDFDGLRPIYQQYLITGYAQSNQPRNKGEHACRLP